MGADGRDEDGDGGGSSHGVLARLQPEQQGGEGDHRQEVDGELFVVRLVRRDAAELLKPIESQGKSVEIEENGKQTVQLKLTVTDAKGPAERK